MVVEFMLLFWTKQSYWLIKNLEFVKSIGELLKLVQTTYQYHYHILDNYYMYKIHCAVHSAALWQILVHWGLDKPLLKIHGVLIKQKM